jgi:hypothetical protein
MTLQSWRDRLHHEMHKRGLPASYSARLIDELADHFIDIQLENSSMDAQPSIDEVLGTPGMLALAAERHFIGSTFAGRHPFFAFVFLPLPAVVLTMAVVAQLYIPLKYLVEMATATILSTHEPSVTHSPTAFDWSVAYGFMYVLRFLPFILTALVFVRLGRNANRPFWSFVACGFVAMFGLVFYTSVLPGPGHTTGRLWIGFGLLCSPVQWLQAALPLAFGLSAWLRISTRLPFHFSDFRQA